MVRLGGVRDVGISYYFHSDIPMTPSQPLYLMWSVVNRTSFSGNVAEEKITMNVSELKCETFNFQLIVREYDKRTPATYFSTNARHIDIPCFISQTLRINSANQSSQA